MEVFDSLSGRKEGLTYSVNSMMYLNRIGSLLQIVCHINGRRSHIVDSSYIHSNILNTWDKIRAKALEKGNKTL